MNPIHEAGLASLFLLALASTPGALASLLALVLARAKPRAARLAAGSGAVLSALVLLVAATITIRLHQRIDFWIDTGGYGPPAEVRRTHAPEWHDSARITAIVGVLFTALPLLFAWGGHKRARGRAGWGRGAILTGVFVGLSLLFCLVMCLV